MRAGALPHRPGGAELALSPHCCYGLGMNKQTALAERRTSADVVFDSLYHEIVGMRMLPGTRISEAEVAARFGVSRQPVRDAFSRLGNLGFLLIRPQKATEVQKFSNDLVVTARFLRAAIEVEVVALATRRWDGGLAAAFDANLAAQDEAARTSDIAAFHRLDYDFHRLICEAAATPFAFGAILENKAQIDRLCMLSMTDGDALRGLVADHREIHRCLCAQDAEAAVAAMRAHLARLGRTIDKVRASHPHFFV